MPKLPADDCSGTTVRLTTLTLKTNPRGGEGQGPTKRAGSTTNGISLAIRRHFLKVA